MLYLYLTRCVVFVSNSLSLGLGRGLSPGAEQELVEVHDEHIVDAVHGLGLEPAMRERLRLLVPCE